MMTHFRIPALLISACVVAAGTLFTAQSTALDIVPVVGVWTSSLEAGEPVVTSDPARWDGTSGPDLDAIARTLFKDPRPVFAANAAPGTAYPLAIVKGVEGFSGGTLQVQFKLIAGPSDQTAGLAFGIGPSADFFYVRYNTKDGNVAVWEFVDGKRRVLAHGEAHAQLPLDVWHEFSVKVSGRQVSGTVAGLSVEHELTQPVSGRVGFWTKRDAASAFKNLRISK